LHTVIGPKGSHGTFSQDGYLVLNKQTPSGWEKLWVRHFEGDCDILRTISQPRTLSANIPVSQKGVYLFYNPSINFLRTSTVNKTLGAEKPHSLHILLTFSCFSDWIVYQNLDFQVTYQNGTVVRPLHFFIFLKSGRYHLKTRVY